MEKRLIDVLMTENDVNAKTVGDFLKELLLRLWGEGEEFSSKRPFGNSDWQYQVYASLIKAGYEIGSLDEYGYVADVDYWKADALVELAINEVFSEPVKHGEWIETRFADEPTKIVYSCSGCHTIWEFGSAYCPNCGAKMDLEE